MDNRLLNVYEGRDSVLDYINPDKAPYTPLVEIPDHLNPYRKKGVRIFAKLMNTLPLANIKSLPAYNMLYEKKLSGDLNDCEAIIENSSGNTVFSLSVIAGLLGVGHTKSVCSHEISRGKLNILRFLGTEVIINKEAICPDPSDKSSGIYKAKIWAQENNWFNPGQYDNQANPEAHYKWTGPQIWEQTKQKVSIVSVGLGTTGSAVGIGTYLKERNDDVAMLGVARSANNAVPGPRTLNLLKEIAFDWRSKVDFIEEVGSVDSYRKSMDLCRAGLFVGPSSGFALVGLLNYLSKQNLESGQEKIAVFICPDGPFPYIDEYFKYLNDDDFPKIINEQLLASASNLNEVNRDKVSHIQKLEPQEVFQLVFNNNVSEVWKELEVNNNYSPQSSFLIVDLRSSDHYEEHHIPGAINISLDKLDSFLANGDSLKNYQSVIFVCRYGKASVSACEIAMTYGVDAISMKGGDVEWSRLNLPRYRSEKCVRFKMV